MIQKFGGDFAKHVIRFFSDCFRVNFIFGTEHMYSNYRFVKIDFKSASIVLEIR